jgi:murein tripeptide amidase MpaA
VKIAKSTGGSGHRHGVLFIGGVHARELVNPDTLLSWALGLCQAYTNGTGLTFGPKSYSSGIVKLLVEGLDILVLPCVNPDGRAYVQAVGGNPWWRKSRSLNPGLPCRGVDLNRNCDFLWSSGIGTSADSCSDVFKGPTAFSEPETQNVRWLLDTYTNIECMIDVHSYSQLVLYPWGDDENQTTDPNQNFRNPAYDGLRGGTGDTTYREYIPASDQSWFQQTGNRIRDAIAAIRGRVYTVQQSIQLYPTTGTWHDYAYSRHFVDASKRRVYSYTLETATEFQPPAAEAANVTIEVSAGLTEFATACLCIIEELTRGTALSQRLDRFRHFRDEVMRVLPAGQRYLRLVDLHGAELVTLVMGSRELSRQASTLVGRLAELLPEGRRKRAADAKTVTMGVALLDRVADRASPGLRRALTGVKDDAEHFRGKSLADGLAAASQRPKPPRKGAAGKRR